MGDVASANISHEQTQSNQVCCFQTLNAVFPTDLFLFRLFRCLQFVKDSFMKERMHKRFPYFRMEIELGILPFQSRGFEVG